MPMGMWSTNISSLQLEPSGCYGFMGELGVLGVGPVPVAALQSHVLTEGKQLQPAG